MKRRVVALMGVVPLIAAGFVVTSPAALATKPPDHLITICHATASYTNPYVVITVDVASTHFAGHEGHTGPIFYPAIPKHTEWGDIIPPTSNDGTRSVPPMNWTAAGQAIWNNGCKIPAPPRPTSTPSPTSRPTPPCEENCSGGRPTPTPSGTPTPRATPPSGTPCVGVTTTGASRCPSPTPDSPTTVGLPNTGVPPPSIPWAPILGALTLFSLVGILARRYVHVVRH